MVLGLSLATYLYGSQHHWNAEQNNRMQDVALKLDLLSCPLIILIISREILVRLIVLMP